MKLHEQNLVTYLRMALAKSKEIDYVNKVNSARSAAIEQTIDAINNGEKVEVVK